MKSKVNRGATHRGEANYKNQATKLYNEGKILKNIDKKFKSPEHKRIFNDMTQANWDKAYEQSLKEKEAEFQKANPRINPRGTVLGGSPRTHGVYGGMLNGKGLQNIDNKEHQRLARLDEKKNGTIYKDELKEIVGLDGKLRTEYRSTNVPDFGWSSDTTYSTNRQYYEVGNQREEYAVEFSHAELNRNSRPTERTEFKNKIDEDIYRAKKHLLKTRGTY